MTEVPTVSCLFVFITGLRLTSGRTAYQRWEGHKAGENKITYKAGKPRFKNIFQNEVGLKSLGLVSCI